MAELLDGDRVARRKHWRTFEASGYDRGDGFYDSGNFLRQEAGGRYVMLDTDGPGCLDRMWFTRKSTREPWQLELYLDGSRRPVVRADLDELAGGQLPRFPAPLAGSVDLARYSLVPIGFRRHCTAVLVQTAPPDRYTYRTNSFGLRIPHVYYQLTFRRLPAGADIQPFRWNLDSAEAAALRHLIRLWNHSGESPWTTAARALDHKRLTIAPGAAVDLFAAAGSGTVREVRLRPASAAAAHALRFEAFWEGEGEPAISAPLSALWPGSDPRASVKGFWLGSDHGEDYCYLPMPYRHGARIRVVSTAAVPLEVESTVSWTPRPPDADAGHLCAYRYDYQPPLPPRDYTVLNVKGAGHWVGMVMDRPGDMEGDDQFFVDGEPTASIHGTGTEDFFSFAWGFSHVTALPLHGGTRSGGPALYRFHLPAAVPFRRSLRITWEHGHANRHQGRYSGVAFYYQFPG